MKQVESISIGIFSESFTPVTNGVAVSIATQRESLQRRGHKTYVFAPQHPKRDPAEKDVFRFPSVTPPGISEYPLALPYLPSLLLRANTTLPNLHIIHTHTPFVLGSAGLACAKRLGLPIISTYHTLYTRYVHYVPILPKHWIQRELEAHLNHYYNQCNLVICPSKIALDDLRSKGISVPMEIVPTATPLPTPEHLKPETRAEARTHLGVANDEQIILYVGRLSPEKNLYTLLEIFRLVANKAPKVRLVLMGWGTERTPLQQKARGLGLGDSVLFPQPLPHAKMSSIFGCADVFCLTSTSETQGLVVDEARASCLPVVVAYEGGASEGVTHGLDGFVVAAQDHTRFAEHILRLLNDESIRSRFIANGRQRILENSPERMAERLESLYLRVLTSTSSQF